MKYFSYDPLDSPSVALHDTPEEAKTRADKALDYAKQEASDGGWDDVVVDNPICWGAISELMTKTMERPATPDEKANGFDYMKDYELKAPC